MFDWLTEQVADNPITYLVIFVATAFDAVVPLIPSETILIAAGVIAGQGGLLIIAVVPAATFGAILGDNISFLLGRRVGDPIATRLFRGERARARLRWAEGAIERHGPLLIVIARFVPGGRTATTFAAGTLGMRYRRFLAADVLAALAWALYLSLLGYIGGSRFEDEFWLPLGASLGVAAAVALAVEAWRRLQRRRGRDLLGDELDP